MHLSLSVGTSCLVNAGCPLLIQGWIAGGSIILDHGQYTCNPKNEYYWVATYKSLAPHFNHISYPYFNSLWSKQMGLLYVCRTHIYPNRASFKL